MTNVKQVSRRKKMDERERETRDLQDNQLTNPKTQTPSKNKNKKEERKFQLKTHWNAKYLEEMKTIWTKLPTLKFNPPKKKQKNKKERKKKSFSNGMPNIRKR
jgi:hypothetical protein